ncbi:hypothetical protein BOTCAL_0017g00310 [Botryotinia calthae]|uniref:Uncharacterized protein n=1 Tax=Botryotinia calthae TaxID=38488 RepID=A0A4Y8DI13_9HELO|nr:hypothetical protein BOTCAL_0017g00310 [Botryotinia calthae]
MPPENQTWYEVKLWALLLNCSKSRKITNSSWYQDYRKLKYDQRAAEPSSNPKKPRIISSASMQFPFSVHKVTGS